MIDHLGWRSAHAHVGRIAQSPPSHTLSSSIAPSPPSPSLPRPHACLTPYIHIGRGHVGQHGKAPQRRRRGPRLSPQRREPGSRMGRLGGDRLRGDEVRCLLPSSTGICTDATYLPFRYAEVLIDVRAHTETMVSQDCEHLYVCSRSISPGLSHRWHSQACCVSLDRGTHERLIHSLSSWHFEPHKLPEEEVIACSYILFEALYRIENMQETVSVSLGEHLSSSSALCSSLAPCPLRP